jgi:hypothetical protein
LVAGKTEEQFGVRRLVQPEFLSILGVAVISPYCWATQRRIPFGISPVSGFARVEGKLWG